LPVKCDNWFSLNEIINKRDSITRIILDLKMKESILKPSQAQQTVQENFSNLIEIDNNDINNEIESISIDCSSSNKTYSSSYGGESDEEFSIEYNESDDENNENYYGDKNDQYIDEDEKNVEFNDFYIPINQEIKMKSFDQIFSGMKKSVKYKKKFKFHYD